MPCRTRPLSSRLNPPARARCRGPAPYAPAGLWFGTVPASRREDRQLPAEEADHRIRNVVVLRVLGEVIWVGADRDQVKRQIPYHLR